MKTLLRFLFASCVLAGAAFAAGAKQKTYYVSGTYDRVQPKTELVAKAVAEVSAKMKDAVNIQNADEADELIQIHFKRDGTYRINWDAYPSLNETHPFPRWDLDRQFHGPGSLREAEGKSGEMRDK